MSQGDERHEARLAPLVPTKHDALCESSQTHRLIAIMEVHMTLSAEQWWDSCSQDSRLMEFVSLSFEQDGKCLHFSLFFSDGS